MSVSPLLQFRRLDRALSRMTARAAQAEAYAPDAPPPGLRRRFAESVQAALDAHACLVGTDALGDIDGLLAATYGDDEVA